MNKKKGAPPPLPKKTSANKKRQNQLVKTSKISVPAAKGKNISQLGRPQIRKVGNSGDIIVVHREFVTDLIASATAGAFSVFGFPINPGNLLIFPWLSSIAKNYSSYVFDALKFYIETESPSSIPGTALMAIDYDANDVLPSDKRTMMSLRDAVRTEAWGDIAMGSKKEDLHKRKTYFNALPGDFSPSAVTSNTDMLGDRRLDDVGQLLLATTGMPANQVVGEVYVEYEVRMETPTNNANLIPLYTLITGTAQSGMTPAQPWGANNPVPNPTNAQVAEYAGLPISYAIVSGNDYFLFGAPGTYHLSCSMNGTAFTTGIVLSTSGANTNLVGTSLPAFTTVAAAISTYVQIGATPFLLAGLTTPIYGAIGPSIGATTITGATMRISQAPPYRSTTSGPSLSSEWDMIAPFTGLRGRVMRLRGQRLLGPSNSSGYCAYSHYDAGEKSPMSLETWLGKKRHTLESESSREPSNEIEGSTNHRLPEDGPDTLVDCGLGFIGPYHHRVTGCLCGAK